MMNKYPPATALFLGVRPGIGVSTLVVNVALVLGVFARARTLLLDISANPAGVGARLGLAGPCGLLNLVGPFLREGRLEPETLAGQVIRYEPGQPWPADGASLDVLPGFDRRQLSPAQADRLAAYRGAGLVDAVYQAAGEAGYEVVLADGGVWSNGVPGLGVGLARVPGWGILVSSSRPEDVANTALPARRLREVGWKVLVVLTQAARWSFSVVVRAQVRGRVVFERAGVCARAVGRVWRSEMHWSGWGAIVGCVVPGTSRQVYARVDRHCCTAQARVARRRVPGLIYTSSARSL